jgi:uncharacterized lipoprotein YajG
MKKTLFWLAAMALVAAIAAPTALLADGDPSPYPEVSAVQASK